jgi:hypothetical protein
MSTTNANQASHQEGRLLLAIQALEKGQFSSVRAAARVYDVPHTSLVERLCGRTNAKDSQVKNQKLSPTEESVLLQWIISMDDRGQSPRVATVRETANLILANRDPSASPPTVGVNWPKRFIDRHPELKTRFSQRYDYQRALCEDPKIIREWFRLVQNTIAKYGILLEDIYNFDETGFQMGIIGTAKVVTGSERILHPKIIQPGNTEWVTVVEGINAAGWTLPSMIIFKGKLHQASWYQNDLPHNWRIETSENGWTNDKLGLVWLKEIFNKHTQSRTIGRYRLLILDGHGSHSGPEFDQFCTENSIIPLYMPPHSSHLLQPLDVSCFSPLKQAYRKQVEKKMGLGINHIDKDEFLTIYSSVHTEALNEKNIQSGFRATGLVPYDPEQVLSRLNIQMKTPTPPGTSHSSQASWATATPHNVRQLELQSEKIKGYLKCHTLSPPSPSKRALDQLVKGCRMAMHGAAILARENSELRAANAKQKRKRETKRAYISQGEGLTVEEGMNRVQRAAEEERELVEQADSRPRKRAVQQCSVCGILGHTARTCSQRIRSDS